MNMMKRRKTMSSFRDRFGDLTVEQVIELNETAIKLERNKNAGN